MNRILSFGLAAVMATALTPTVFAKGGGNHGGGGHGGGGGHAGGGGAPHFSAPAHASGGGGHAHFSAPSHGSVAHAPAMRAHSAPRIVQHSAPRSFERTPNHIQSRPQQAFTPQVARRAHGREPSVAFGGHAVTRDNAVVNNNAAVKARNARAFSTNDAGHFAGRGNARDIRPPIESSRGWDRGRVHEWNHHHFRWSGGNWVIIEPGFGYPYGYSDYDEVTPYSAVPYSYGSSMDLTMSVQDQLTRLGYNPGPIDGVMGGQTRDAIADFQNDNRLPVTGGLDTATLQALGL